MGFALSQPIFRFASDEDGEQPGITALELNRSTWLPKAVLVEVTAADAGNVDFMSVPAGTFIQCALAVIETGFSGTTPTVDIGTDGVSNALVANADFSATVDTADAYAQPDKGIYIPAVDNLRLTVGGTGTPAGKVRLILLFWELDNMAARGIQVSATI